MQTKKFTDFINESTSSNSPDYVAGVTSTETKKVPFAQISRNYTSYVALLNQTGTDAPVATVLYNDLSASITWTRVGAGDYLGTLTGAFPQNKTFMIAGGTVSIPFGGSINSHTYLFWNDVNSIGLWVGEAAGLGGSNLSDGLLAYASIEIRVYE